MKCSRTGFLTILSLVLPATTLLFVQAQVAVGQQLRFQRPSNSQQSLRDQQINSRFRSPTATVSKTETEIAAKSAPKLAQAPTYQPAAKPIQIPVEVARSLRELQRDSQLRQAPIQQLQHVPELAEEVEAPQAEPSKPPITNMGSIEKYEEPCDSCGMYAGGGGCGCEVSCGLADTCCGACEPGCGCAEPTCGFAEPSCGCAEPSCGSCVGLPGPDYWCFPVCLPRFKDFSVWAGPHGFRGPRDFYAPGSVAAGSRSDSNFGFHEGINVSGRAPFIGLIFPQLSYQLGYQGVHSRFDGTAVDVSSRTQQFVTAGLFRRVHTGLQFGVVWDAMRDDLYAKGTLHQIRSEVSLKSPLGREIGFWTANSTNNIAVFDVVYKTVNQYAFFYRCNFGKSSTGRLWIGGTNDDEGIFGADFNAPLNDRWSLQAGFNYLFPDKEAGLDSVSEESWNVGFNIVWHLGKTARNCYRSPYRPLFSVADNGWMLVDLVGTN